MSILNTEDVARALGPIAENVVGQINKGLQQTAGELVKDVRKLLNGAKITVTIELTQQE